MSTNKDIIQKENSQEVSNANTDLLSSLLGSPEKLFDYLVKVLFGFLVASISMLIIIGKDQQ